MSKDNVNPESETPSAIAGSGGVAPNYAAMMAGDVETRAGSVAPNYAVSADVAPTDPVQIVDAPETTDPK